MKRHDNDHNTVVSNSYACCENNAMKLGLVGCSVFLLKVEKITFKHHHSNSNYILWYSSVGYLADPPASASPRQYIFRYPVVMNRETGMYNSFSWFSPTGGRVCCFTNGVSKPPSVTK